MFTTASHIPQQKTLQKVFIAN